MDLKEYQICAMNTAIYPQHWSPAYQCLGLCGEVGELREKMHTMGVKRQDLILELGDIMWYCATLTKGVGVDLIEVQSPRGVMEVLAMQAAEKTKRICRSGHTEELALEIQQIVGRIITEIRYISKIYDIELEDILKQNIEKLKDRKERGVLHSSGDQR